jgi:hypothetical protein
MQISRGEVPERHRMFFEAGMTTHDCQGNEVRIAEDVLDGALAQESDVWTYVLNDLWSTYRGGSVL